MAVWEIKIILPYPRSSVIMNGDAFETTTTYDIAIDAWCVMMMMCRDAQDPALKQRGCRIEMHVQMSVKPAFSSPSPE